MTSPSLALTPQAQHPPPRGPCSPRRAGGRRGEGGMGGMGGEGRTAGMTTGAREGATASRTLCPRQSLLPRSPRSQLPSISAPGIISKAPVGASSRTSGITTKVTERTRTQPAISTGHGTMAALLGISSTARILRARGKACPTALGPKASSRRAPGRALQDRPTPEGGQSPATAGRGTGLTDPAWSRIEA